MGFWEVRAQVGCIFICHADVLKNLCLKKYCFNLVAERDYSSLRRQKLWEAHQQATHTHIHSHTHACSRVCVHTPHEQHTNVQTWTPLTHKGTCSPTSLTGTPSSNQQTCYCGHSPVIQPELVALSLSEVCTRVHSYSSSELLGICLSGCREVFRE